MSPRRTAPADTPRVAAPGRLVLSPAWLAVAALVLASALFKIAAFRDSPNYSPLDDTGLFWTESSFHYRYARMIARGEPVPALDRDAEWPDGVSPRREFTMGMEDAAGRSYRVLAPLLGRPPFHVYLIGFVAFWSSLSIAAAFAAGRALWGSPSAGLVAAAAYALSPVSMTRTVWNYVREDFTLPFLFASYAFLVAILARRDGGPPRAAGDPGAGGNVAAGVGAGASRGAGANISRGVLVSAVLAGVALAAGVSTWHLARFYLTALFALLAAAALVVPRTPPRGLRVFLAGALGALTLAGLAVPVLREKRFLVSPAYLVGAGLFVAALAAERGRPRSLAARAAVVAAVVVGANLLARVLPGAEGEYAHVTGLIWAKLRFLGIKPADPGLLSDDARVFWVGPFDSPSVTSALLSLSGMILWAPAAAALALRALFGRRRAAGATDAVAGGGRTPLVLTLLLALFFAAAYLLIERMSVFLVFFAALLAPGLLRFAGERRRRAVAILLAAIALGQALYLRDFSGPNPVRRFVEARFGAPPSEAVPNLGNNRRLVGWIRGALPDRGAVLTWFPAGPMILTDTGHPIPLHPMFESSALRARERRVREALYGHEEGFFALCEEWRVDYVLYQANLLLDSSLESYRYMADRMSVPTTSSAFLFHFAPERLRRFGLVYQDSYYRLYEVVRGGSPRALPGRLAYQEMFDPAPLGAWGDTYPDAATQRVLARVTERLDLTERGLAAESAGRRDEARAIYRGVLARSPDAPEAKLRLALIALDLGQVAEADSLVESGLAARAWYPEMLFAKGLVLERQSRPDEAAAAYRKVLEIAPGSAPASERLALLTGSRR